MKLQKKYLFIFSIFLFILFVFFSYIVSKEVFAQIDFDITVKIQDKLSRKVDYPFSILSVLGSAEITGIIWFLFLALALLKKYWRTAITLFLLPMALAMEVFGKLFIYHPGPPHLFYRGLIEFNFPSHYVPVYYSYPSGHVLRTTFLIIFVMLLLYFKFKLKHQLIFQLSLITLLVLMLVSRVYLGEHWTSDVIGGVLIGTSFGILSALTIPRKKHE